MLKKQDLKDKPQRLLHPNPVSQFSLTHSILLIHFLKTGVFVFLQGRDILSLIIPSILREI